MTTAEMLLRLGTGVGLGAVIGIERQYRARMAGPRINALVAVLTADQRDDKQMESAVSRLSLEPSVTSVRWRVHVPSEHHDEEDG